MARIEIENHFDSDGNLIPPVAEEAPVVEEAPKPAPAKEAAKAPTKKATRK